MEWMLQVVDEIDDAVGAVRLCCVGIAAESGLAAIVLSLGAALKIYRLQLKTDR
jgi:hypothetical protein